jgi:signal transduction histidine kinase
LRTPLTSIRAFSEILFDNAALDVAQRQEFLGIIIRESERLTRLINQVLDLAKIEAGRFDWQIGDVDLKEVIADAVAATSQLFRERAIAVTTAVPERMPMIRSDRDQLMQVMLNLLSNAAKFARPGAGRVTVAAETDGRAITVGVADNGPGVPPEHHETIFEKFRQFPDAARAKPEGSGLGLAICQRIVEHLGGRIWLESAPGQGSVFRFTVPIEAPVQAAPAIA